MTEARYEVRPSVLVPGYSVIDADANRVARKGKRILAGLDLDAAHNLRARLENAARKRKVCKTCRHLAPAVDVINGQCDRCRTP